ncbi:MAG: CinA family protein [Alphaproteobacteria bacterium]
MLERCRAQKLRVATAESCTGGMVATALTGIAGSSDVFERGFVTYSNDAKAESLGVPRDILRAHGAVSEPVARAMAEGAIAHSYAEIAVAITGIAGPGGGGPGKPVGLVHFASTRKGGTTRAEHHVFAGDRAAVRAQSAELALRLLLQQAEQA